MPANAPIPGIAPNDHRRFARLPVGREIAEQGRQVWKQPDFSVKETNGTTQFIFSVPIKSRFQKLAPRNYEILFRTKKTAWIDALERAYREAQSRKHKYLKNLDVGLYKLFSEALLILTTDIEGLTEDYAETMREEAIKFREAVPRSRGQKPAPKRLKRLAKRFKILLPRMRELHKFVKEQKKSGIDTEEGLREKVKEAFQDDWIPIVITGAAFQRLPSYAAQGGGEISSSLGGKWAPWQLTTGIIRCEEETLTHKALTATTVYKNVMQGRKPSSKPST